MRIGLDIGGTFTDIVAVDPQTGELRVGKALNSGQGPAAGLEAALEAAATPAASVREITHGTTTVTNLLIERTGATVGLVCTRGFRDVLEIQMSFRERTFDARYAKTPPLVPRRRRLEIGGRIDRDGLEAEPLDPGEVDRVLRALYADGVECLAIALYNAYANPAHERAVAEAWRRLAPDRPVTCATDVDRRIGEYERTSTAVLNATAVPRMRRYVGELGAALGAPTLYMHSAGGVIGGAHAAEHPIQLAFSGPAAGVLAARRVARELDLQDVITLDMGGTSCDVCLVRGGELRHRESFEVAWGVPARVRCLDISTVGAGGGSIAHVDAGGALAVGPRSAGALPGPVCYGRGGSEPTVTDANLALGIIGAQSLLGGTLPLDAEAAWDALSALAGRCDAEPEATAHAVHALVNANMAQAVREITVRHGIDPRDCALVAFGGAGPQHAAGVARELGLSTVVVPAQCSLLSALGLLGADVQTAAARTLLVDVAELATPATRAIFDELAGEAGARMAGATVQDMVAERWAGLRYRDQWHEVALRLHDEDTETLVERFGAEHERRFGTRLEDPIVVVDVWVTLVGARGDASVAPRPVVELRTGGADRTRDVLLAGAAVPVLGRGELTEDPLPGPLLLQEPGSVTFVPAGASACARAGHIVVEL